MLFPSLISYIILFIELNCICDCFSMLKIYMISIRWKTFSIVLSLAQFREKLSLYFLIYLFFAYWSSSENLLIGSEAHLTTLLRESKFDGSKPVTSIFLPISTTRILMLQAKAKPVSERCITRMPKVLVEVLSLQIKTFFYCSFSSK